MSRSLCPVCGRFPDPATQRCLCPPPASASSVESLAKAESLFESYLAARIVRARRQLKATKVECLREPRNRRKAEALRRMESEVERLELQLLEQARHAATRQAMGSATRSSSDEIISATAAPEDPANVAAEQAPGRHDPQPAASVPARDRRCPRCGSQLPGAVRECRCGYTVETDDSSAPLFLSDEELRALRRGPSK